MRIIDLESWPRRKHFEFFSAFDLPHFNLCAEVEIRAFHAEVKRQGLSFGLAVVYLLATAANDIPELRMRIRGQQVVEHEVVHPSFTVLAGDELFGFCDAYYGPDFAAFAAGAEERMARARAHAGLEDEGPGGDDRLFMTGIPWISFTGVMHPLRLYPVDSIPRIAWGKFYPDGDRLTMPLSLQAHHALVDGVHAGRFFKRVQEHAGRPEQLLGPAHSRT